MEYVQFKSDFYISKKNFRTFKNPYGEKPYLDNNTLYIPIEMLAQEYKKNFNIKSEQEEEDDQEQDEEINLGKRKPSGLENIGGICYLNAVLQCFYYCRPLTEYFLRKDIKKNLGPISEGYFEFVNDLSSGKSCAAKKIKEAIMNVDETFIGNDGKDSKDVAILILSELQSELQDEIDDKVSNSNNNKKVDHFNLLDIYNEKINQEKKSKTIISDTFNYLIKYVQMCENSCPKFKKKFFNIESDNILIFELEKIYNSIHKKDKYIKNPEISLEECLNHYKWNEKIECPYCKDYTLIIKKTICSLPKIFIFVLSRGHNIKFDCKINFNENLDMNKYFDPINEQKKGNNTYKLIGATFAYDWTKGYRHSGHTVAFCKSYNGNNNYYIFNDSRAIKSSISEIRNKTPYLLFYEKCI